MIVTKYIRVELLPGQKYDVIAHVIAANRALYVANTRSAVQHTANDRYQHIFEQEYVRIWNSDEELIQWATSQFTWASAKVFAIPVNSLGFFTSGQTAEEKEHIWKHGIKEIITVELDFT